MVKRCESILLVNKDYVLSSNYIPLDLEYINARVDRVDEKKFMRHRAAVYLRKMFYDAGKMGLELVAISGFRSYVRQEEIYNNSVNEKGLEYTKKYIAYPGTSEHQTGLAMDVSCKGLNYGLEEEFAYTKEGKWLEYNCYKYGFILRYPRECQHITGYNFEPWHIRYIGILHSTNMKKNQIRTLEEYLEKNTKLE